MGWAEARNQCKTVLTLPGEMAQDYLGSDEATRTYHLALLQGRVATYDKQSRFLRRNIGRQRRPSLPPHVRDLSEEYLLTSTDEAEQIERDPTSVPQVCRKQLEEPPCGNQLSNLSEEPWPDESNSPESASLADSDDLSSASNTGQSSRISSVDAKQKQNALLDIYPSRPQRPLVPVDHQTSGVDDIVDAQTTPREKAQLPTPHVESLQDTSYATHLKERGRSWKRMLDLMNGKIPHKKKIELEAKVKQVNAFEEHYDETTSCTTQEASEKEEKEHDGAHEGMEMPSSLSWGI